MRNLSLIKKLTIIYVILLGIILSIVLGSLRYSFSVYDRELYEKSLQELEFFAERVDDSFRAVENFVFDITISMDFQIQMTELKSMTPGTGAYNYEMYTIRTALEKEVRTHPIVTNIRFYDTTGKHIAVGTEPISLPKQQESDFLNDIKEAKGAYLIEDPSPEYPYYVSGRSILKHIDSSMDYLGSYLVSSDAGLFIQKQIDTLSVPGSRLYVYSESGYMVYQSDTSAISPSLADSDYGYRICNESGRKYFCCWLKDAESGWLFMNMTPYSDIYGETQQIRTNVVLILLIVFVAGFIVLYRLSRTVTKPLRKLTETAQVVKKGNFDIALSMLPHIDYSGEDEAKQLTQEFRTLLQQIQHLIRDIYETQILLQDTRYRMLQAQINPHFLYNTLNTVTWMIRSNEKDNAVSMLIDLSELLRAALSRDLICTVEEDLVTAESYISIQKFRFEDQVDFRIQRYGNLEKYYMPRMIFQPLIENAITYGVEEKDGTCHIWVIVTEEEQKIRLCVKDDGPGMTEERLHDVKNGTAVPYGHGIGLNNIRNRLMLLFGNVDMNIESSPGLGTIVEIYIPKTTKKPKSLNEV